MVGNEAVHHDWRFILNRMAGDRGLPRGLTPRGKTAAHQRLASDGLDTTADKPGRSVDGSRQRADLVGDRTSVDANRVPRHRRRRRTGRRAPYQVLEGLAITALAVGACRGFVVVKRRFEREIAALLTAIDEMRDAGLLGRVPIQLVLGPDEYLLGEEKAAIEVIECAAPLPRIFPPHQMGPFARRDSPNPTVMDNVETLAHVPEILRRGPAWFRSSGTDTSPGTAVFTISGDVRRPGVVELPLGVPLRLLVGGGVVAGRRVKAVFPGASGAMLTAEQLDVPLDFDSMRDAGTGLGSAGFVVYDDSACIVAATLAFSRFLAIESCAQCPACKQGTLSITDCLDRIERGDGSQHDLDTILAKCATVTGGRRCAPPTGEAELVRGALARFPDEFRAHLGRACPLPRDLPVPKFVDFDEESGTFGYGEHYRLKQPDWSFAVHSDSDRERSA
jgi:NADH:ubiquinone oxidoreductase subunit F (NADH-binding)